MAYNIQELLSLPANERKKITSQLIESLPENRLTKEEIVILNERWENHQSGKSKNYSSAEMRKLAFKK